VQVGLRVSSESVLVTDSASPGARASALVLRSRPLALGAAILLVAELVVLKLWFKTDVLEDSSLWWAGPVRALRFNTPFGLCALAGILLVGRRRIVEAFGDEAAGLDRERRFAIPLVLHVLGIALFCFLTARMLAPDLGEGTLAALLPLPWLASGIVAFAAVACLAVPLEVVLRIGRRLRSVLLLGTALGGTVFGLGSLLNRAWPLADLLGRATLWMSDRLLGLFLAERVYLPEEMILGTEAFPVHVTKFCSGYEGISLFLVFFCLFLVLWRERLRFPQALVLLPIGVFLAWLLNAGRIAALVLVGTYLSPDLAIEGFHVYAGWPLLCGVALGCVALGTRLPAFARSTVPLEGGVNPTGVYLGPLLLSTACGLVLGAFSRHPESLDAARAVPVLALLLYLRKELPRVLPSSTRELASGLAYGVVVFAAWTALALLVPRSVPLRGPDPLEWRSVAWIVRVLAMCALTPVIEELAFRGFLARRVVDPDFERVDPRSLGMRSFLVTSVAFALLHSSAVAAFGAGAALFLAYRRSGSLAVAVLAHASANVFVILATLATGDPRIFG
jgi:exosortase E/protease (VPEID-CTERM system)